MGKWDLHRARGILVRMIQQKFPIWGWSVHMGEDAKTHLREKKGAKVLSGLSGERYGPIAGTCERSNWTWGFGKWGNFLAKLFINFRAICRNSYFPGIWIHDQYLWERDSFKDNMCFIQTSILLWGLQGSFFLPLHMFFYLFVRL
jgi:hypothetical protein